jgi:hypothetical protein
VKVRRWYRVNYTGGKFAIGVNEPVANKGNNIRLLTS